MIRLTDEQHLDRQMRHDIDVVVDRVVVNPASRGRLAEAVELALKIGSGNMVVASEDGDGLEIPLSAHYACTHCQVSFEPPSPQLFSFNSPQGMCLECNGLGEIYTFDRRLVPDPGKSFSRAASS